MYGSAKSIATNWVRKSISLITLSYPFFLKLVLCFHFEDGVAFHKAIERLGVSYME